MEIKPKDQSFWVVVSLILSTLALCCSVALFYDRVFATVEVCAYCNNPIQERTVTAVDSEGRQVSKVGKCDCCEQEITEWISLHPTTLIKLNAMTIAFQNQKIDLLHKDNLQLQRDLRKVSDYNATLSQKIAAMEKRDWSPEREDRNPYSFVQPQGMIMTTRDPYPDVVRYRSAQDYFRAMERLAEESTKILDEAHEELKDGD